MKLTSVSFAQLRNLLLDLNFEESRQKNGWRFEHPESDTVFLFRPYRPSEKLNAGDLGSTRMQLEWRGLVSADRFDDLLRKTPA